jgi:hypothetical protein
LRRTPFSPRTMRCAWPRRMARSALSYFCLMTSEPELPLLPKSAFDRFDRAALLAIAVLHRARQHMFIRWFLIALNVIQGARGTDKDVPRSWLLQAAKVGAICVATPGLLPILTCRLQILLLLPRAFNASFPFAFGNRSLCAAFRSSCLLLLAQLNPRVCLARYCLCACAGGWHVGHSARAQGRQGMPTRSLLPTLPRVSSMKSVCLFAFVEMLHICVFPR